jgi:hypothetical protein
MNNEDFPALPKNQDSKSSPDRVTTPSESTWNTPRQPHGILEAFSSPATPARSSSKSYSRLEHLRRVNRTYRTRHLSPTTPGETTTGNSETSTSVNTSSKEDQDGTREQAEDQSSALSGYSPGRLSDNSDSSSVCPFNRNSPPRESSEEGSPNTLIDNKEDNDNDDSPNPSNDNDEDNEKEPEIPTPLPNITTTAKMTSFDPDLKHLVVDIIKYDLNHPLAIALEQAYIKTFDKFHSIEIK